MFYGRDDELAFLKEKYASDRAEFVVLYGRRRIGKTALLREFSKNKNTVFYNATEIPDRMQLAKLSKIIVEHFSAKIYSSSFEDWEALFEFIAENTTDTEKLVLIIDEFPYIAYSNKSVASILQKQWDQLLQNQNIMLVLCGSAMSFMENEVLGEKNPLYGRTTGILKLQELDFQDAVKFMGVRSFPEQLTLYSIYSGVPYYLQMIDPEGSIEENIQKSIFSTTSVLFNEPEFLLKQELREVSQYNAIVESIANGDTRMNSIYQKTGIAKSKLPYYLNNLMDIGIVKREFPVTMKTKERAKSKSGLYFIDNNFFRFYYAFVYPYLSEIMEGATDILLKDLVIPNLNEFVSLEYERYSLWKLGLMRKQGQLPSNYIRIGRWWEKDLEIDLVGYDLKGNYLLGECKWRKQRCGMKVFNELQAKTEPFKKKVNSRNSEVYYVIFSKSGFTDELLKTAKNRDDLKLLTN